MKEEEGDKQADMDGQRTAKDGSIKALIIRGDNWIGEGDSR
jgi:hypothetical protein